MPPNQAVIMHKALAEQGLATALVMFKGEQHGFRAAANIRAALDGELYFYGKVRVQTLDFILAPSSFHSMQPQNSESPQVSTAQLLGRRYA